MTFNDANATDRDAILNTAREILRTSRREIRRRELAREILALPAIARRGVSLKHIENELGGLLTRFTDIEKRSRGVYSARLENLAETPPTAPPVDPVNEAAFYQPILEFLKEEKEECVHAYDISGMRRNGKWGNPDIVGVSKQLAADPIKLPSEIVTVEVKAANSQLVEGFGQAVSYKLFSHRVYLAIPSAVEPSEFDRIETLCLREGVGLLTIAGAATEPRIELKIWAQSGNPDAFFVNEFARRIREYDQDAFNGLFS